MTKFIPWAAYVQDENGNHHTWEQTELFEKLQEQTTENPDQLDMESAIETMEVQKRYTYPFNELYFVNSLTFGKRLQY